MKLSKSFTEIEHPDTKPPYGPKTPEFICIDRIIQKKDTLCFCVPTKALKAGAEILAIVEGPGIRKDYQSLFKLGPNYYTSILSYWKMYWYHEIYRDIESTELEQVWSSFVHDVFEGIGPDKNAERWERLPEMWLGELS